MNMIKRVARALQIKQPGMDYLDSERLASAAIAATFKNCTRYTTTDGREFYEIDAVKIDALQEDKP